MRMGRCIWCRGMEPDESLSIGDGKGGYAHASCWEKEKAARGKVERDARRAVDVAAFKRRRKPSRVSTLGICPTCDKEYVRHTRKSKFCSIECLQSPRLQRNELLFAAWQRGVSYAALGRQFSISATRARDIVQDRLWYIKFNS